MLLAGDVGGTKTVLAQYEKSTDGLERVRERIYPSADYGSLEEIVAEFLNDQSVPLEAACFGVAGPVVDGRCEVTNLPWTIDERALSAATGVARVKLLNDLQAMALGLLRLGPEEWLELNPDAEPAPGNRAVLAAGTGLGEAILYWDGLNYHPLATEGGHTDFAPNDALEDGLLAHLREKYGGHVSYERILSGGGIANIYAYLRDTGHAPEDPAFAALLKEAEDPAREISRHALENDDALARATLRLFARIYGAEAGNLALKCLARGGVLIGGGIAPKILSILADGAFMEGFLAKGRFATFLKAIPVRVALNPSTALLGAADYAARCLL
ncbi:glucokinase [Candidatus Methylocalor cossyra]|uniref:Glucokinase n=1 Tax=Candidatus Methylocalor cossyra TaxID=3108543 RepID=A0ABM9NEH5_9GAMM